MSSWKKGLTSVAILGSVALLAACGNSGDTADSGNDGGDGGSGKTTLTVTTWNYDRSSPFLCVKG